MEPVTALGWVGGCGGGEWADIGEVRHGSLIWENAAKINGVRAPKILAMIPPYRESKNRPITLFACRDQACRSEWAAWGSHFRQLELVVPLSIAGEGSCKTRCQRSALNRAFRCGERSALTSQRCKPNETFSPRRSYGEARNHRASVNALPGQGENPPALITSAAGAAGSCRYPTTPNANDRSKQNEIHHSYRRSLRAARHFR